ncbi:hypothetical protein PVK06_010387 [Gossypium arboreum]|uniref:Uncharacterized protein n=1 Tax=Gossypium arboreum TaxID=29729 RepID=A0ABR0Q6S8_GOSAR|nr:hypothetical protein PVK06_010387 [Gossypium arboreum]
MADKGDKETEITSDTEKKGPKQRKSSWGKLRHVDSLNLEAGTIFSSGKGLGSKATTLSLAFQSIGIVYGDLGTSPLYTFAGIFPESIGHPDNLHGALSLILYCIILLPLVKYTFVVLNADNGEVSLVPNQQPQDRDMSNYKLEIPSSQLKRAHYIRGKLESSEAVKIILLLVILLGTSMVIGDGILTPSISEDVVGFTVLILFSLFYAQQFGTDKVGFSFAPILTLWFLLLIGIGLYNLHAYGFGVLRAVNPYYIVHYFRRRGKEGWISPGGVVLSTTGTEAMFADLGHFSVRAIQLSFSFVVMPSILVAYCGQAAYLTEHPTDVVDTFYRSIPAKISGVFSIITQSLSLGCFPKVKVVHTSAKYEGQVYIPEINYILMICMYFGHRGLQNHRKYRPRIWNCLGGCNDHHNRNACAYHAYHMEDKRILGYPLLRVLWHRRACIIHIRVVFATFMMGIMGIWHYVHHKRYDFELRNKVSSEYMTQLAKDPRINRLPGMGLLCSELVHGIPPIFCWKLAIHAAVMFLLSAYGLYGYMDIIGTNEEFEHQLLERLKEFIRKEYLIADGGATEQTTDDGTGGIVPAPIQGVEEEIEFVERAADRGVVYLLGEAHVKAKQNSSILKKIIVDYIYTFLKNNYRRGEAQMMVSHTRLIRVGMSFEI